MICVSGNINVNEKLGKLLETESGHSDSYTLEGMQNDDNERTFFVLISVYSINI